MPDEDRLPEPSRELVESFRRRPPVGTFEPLPGPPGPAWLEPILDRLIDHFDEPEIGAPATPGAIERLRAGVPDCPPELVEFVRRCDGIAAYYDVYGCLHGVDRMLESRSWIVEPWGTRYVPLRTDGCGSEDCLVIGKGPCEGAVVFCDGGSMGPSHLLASNLWSYLDMWSDMLVHSYSPEGEDIERAGAFEAGLQREHSGLDGAFLIGALLQATGDDPELARVLSHPWPFDAEWMQTRDPGLALLHRSDEVRRWLDGSGRVDETPRP